MLCAPELSPMLVGSGMESVRQKIAFLATTPLPVLILGESGVGKELAARGLALLSGRPHDRFVTVNSATLADPLAESLLFGHARGAFTGANEGREGFLDAARGGTLFLDEICELSSAVQAKLLRVLDGNSYTRLGETRVLSVDSRLIMGNEAQAAYYNDPDVVTGIAAGNTVVEVGSVFVGGAGFVKAGVTAYRAFRTGGAFISFTGGMELAGSGLTIPGSVAVNTEAALAIGEGSAWLAVAANGISASGRPTDEFGNPLGGSGKPMIHSVEHHSLKAAKDAARQAGKGAPVKHPSPNVGKRHFHPADVAGEKLPGSPHHEYP